jgi:hypothetical protein
VFLLPALVLGFVFAVLLGGRVSRVLDVRLRLSWIVLVALGLQIVIFSRLGDDLEPSLRGQLHLGSYGLLVLFAAANLRARMLLPVLAGLALNAIAIAANGGKMPLSRAAAEAAGVDPSVHSNVSEEASRLSFLGDVFALPADLPLGNVFSIGDLLIGFGMIGFIVGVATSDGVAPPLSVGRIIAPLRTSVYRRLVAGHLVSQIGDWLTIAALVGWIYQTTGSPAQVAGLLLIRLAPPILGSGLAGLIVDRLPKQHLLVWVELARGAAVAGALAAVLTSNRNLVFVALGVSGGLSAISGAVLPALVPSLLRDEQLPSANAGLGIAKDVAMAVGAAAAGVSLSTVGVAPTLAVDIGTFLLAAVLYGGLRRVSVRTETRGGRGPSAFRYLIRKPALLLLMASFAAATLATGLTNATLAHFLDGAVGLGPSGYGFGIAAIAGGLALGEGLVGFARVGPSAGRWIGGGLLLMGGLFALLALSEHAPTALLLLGAIGFVDGTTDVLYQTVLQRRADPQYHGRVFSLSAAFITTTMMGAFVAAPIASDLIGTQQVILVAGATLLVAGALALAAMARPEGGRALEDGSWVEESQPLEAVANLGALAVVGLDERQAQAADIPVQEIERRLDGDGIRLDLEQVVRRLELLVDQARRLDVAPAERIDHPLHLRADDVRVNTDPADRTELEEGKEDVVVPGVEVQIGLPDDAPRLGEVVIRLLDRPDGRDLGELDDRVRLEVDDHAAGDVVRDDRPVADVGDVAEVLDDPAGGRLVVVRSDDEEPVYTELVRFTRQVNGMSSGVRAGAGDNGAAPADGVDGHAEELEPLVVGEGRAFPRAPRDDDPIGTTVEEFLREFAEALEVDRSVGLERSDDGRQDFAEHGLVVYPGANDDPGRAA